VFIKLSGVGKSLCKCKGVEKSQFYTINKNLDAVTWQNSSSVLISRRFPTKRYLHGTSNQYIEDEDELQENELVLEDYYLYYAFLNCNYGILFACL